MSYLIINSADGALEKFILNRGKTMIGSKEPAQIILNMACVSKIHAQINCSADGKVILYDLNSANGTFVNNLPISQKILEDRDEIRIGNYRLVFHAAPADSEPEAPASKPEAPADHVQLFLDFKITVQDELKKRMNLKKMHLMQLDEKKLKQQANAKIDEILHEKQSEIPGWIDPNLLKKEIFNDTLGLGPLEDFLADESITEIMVNRWNQIYIERSGKIQVSPKNFMDDEQVLAVIQRIVNPLGRTINESTPLVDGRLTDGSRVNAIIPPLAIQGPTLTIRKFSKRRLDAMALVRFGSLNENMVEFLKLCVVHRKNIVISGGTGSGKTTLLNILAGFIPENERIITVEDAAELNLPQTHVVRLEARPPNIEGKGAVPIRDLVKNCLRMRPDRIVVGECRGGEALDMLQAMNTGHDGSLTTGHANSPRDIISRLETMVLMSGMELPLRAIRDQIASAIDIIVQQARLADGSRKITHISEVIGITQESIQLQDLFHFEQQGFDGQGKVVGEFKATGQVPDFIKVLQKRGIPVNLEIFR